MTVRLRSIALNGLVHVIDLTRQEIMDLRDRITGPSIRPGVAEL